MVLIGAVLKGAKLFSFIFKYWYIFFTIVLLLPTLTTSIADAKVESDWSIPFKEVLGEFAVADNSLYEEFSDFGFEKGDPKGVMECVDYYGSLFWRVVQVAAIPLYMTFAFIFIIFKGLFKAFLFFGGNESLKFNAFIVSVVFTLMIQIFVQGVPFKGLITMIKTIIPLL